MKLRSQLFFRDFVAQGYTYPIKLPYTPTNAKAMRYYNRIANKLVFDDIECQVYIGGSFWRDAVMKYRGFDAGFDIDIQVPEDPVITALRSISTDDLPDTYTLALLGTDVSEIDTFVYTYVGSIDDNDWIFAPMRNVGKFGGRKEEYYNVEPGVLTTDTRPVTTRVNSYDLDTSSGTIEVYFCEYTPMPYLMLVFEKMMDLVGKRLTGDVVTDPELRTQVLVNNLTVPIIINTVSGTVNGVFIPADSYGTIALKDMLPQLTGIEFLLRMMRRFNAVPLFRGSTIEFRSFKNILQDQRFDDLTAQMEPRAQLDREDVGITLKDLKEELDDARKIVKYDATKLIASVANVAALGALSADYGDLAKVQLTSAIYKYTASPGLGSEWTFLTFDYSDLTIGNDPKAQDVGVGFVGMHQEESGLDASATWLVPTLDMVMHDPYGDIHNIGANRGSTLRPLFNRGIQEDSNGNPYIFLSNDLKAPDGTALADVTMREALEGEGGIYETWYRAAQEHFSDARVIKRRMRLTTAQIRTWQWERKIMLEGNLYLCREMDVEFTPNGIGLAVLELLRLKVDTLYQIAPPGPFVCAGDGYGSVELLTGGTVNSTTSSGYFTLRKANGDLVTTASGGTASPGPGVYCLWASDGPGGNKAGNLTAMEITNGGFTMVLAGLNALADLVIDFEGLTIDLTGLPSAMYALGLFSPVLTTVTVPAGMEIEMLDASGCIMDVASVDALCNALSPTTSGQNSTIAGGTNAAPTAASATRRALYISNANMLTTN